MIYSQFCATFRNLRKNWEKLLKESEQIKEKEKRKSLSFENLFKAHLNEFTPVKLGFS